MTIFDCLNIFSCKSILIVLFMFWNDLEHDDRSEDVKGTLVNVSGGSLSGKLPDKSDQSSGKCNRTIK